MCLDVDIKFCKNCQQSICLEHSIAVIKFTIEFKPTDFKEELYFCCGACHGIWVVEEIEDKSAFYGRLDPTWFPVMRNLCRELRRLHTNAE